MRLLAFLSLVACNTPAPEPGTWPDPASPAIAVVDGHQVPTGLIDSVVESIPEKQRDQLTAPENYPKFVKDVSVLQAWYYKALEQKLQDDPAIRAKLAVAAREILGQAALDRAVKAEITDEAIQKAYDDKAIQYSRPRAHLLALVVADEAKAAELKGQLEAGADFGELARANSIDGTKSRGGDVGWIDKGRLPQVIDDAVFGAEVGAITGPLETPYGWQLLKVTERKDKIELSEVRDDLAKELEDKLTQEKLKETGDSMAFEYKGPGAAPTTELVPAPQAPPAAGSDK